MTSFAFPIRSFRRVPRRLLLSLLAAGVTLVPLLGTAPRTSGADCGRVSGIVTDAQGNPLIGVTVLIMGSGLGGSEVVHRVITDAQGKFAVERVLPGRYSLRVTSVKHLPAWRNGVQVQPGQTARQNFVLGDIFAPFHIQAPARASVTSAGEDWKWILRTSASTRPILRYRQADGQTPEDSKARLRASQRLLGMMPGPTRSNPLAADPGLGSVLAYVRPLSDDADLLVAGSMGADGLGASSLVTAFRRKIVEGNPQELALVVHQLDLSQGLLLTLPDGQQSVNSAQGVVVSYEQTHRLSEALTLTSGFEIDYLNAWRDAAAARPRARLEYRVSRSSLLTVRYGAAPVSSEGTLLERVGELNAFPRVTLLGYRPRLEKASHAELSFSRKLNKTSGLEVAAYRDDFQDAVVRGFGKPDMWGWVAGNFLPNTAANGVNLNGGNYRSSGLRATVSDRLTRHLEADVLYSTGDALAVRPGALAGISSARKVRDLLQTERGQSVAGKLLAQLPTTKTTVVTSYTWAPRGQVTGVDPYGHAGLELQPYLCMRVRQPLPSPSFLPAHIEAVADFQNLLAQGYIRLRGSRDEPVILTPVYRSFRGGFSVQF